MVSLTTEMHFLDRKFEHTWKIYEFTKSLFYDGDVLFGSKFNFEDGTYQLSMQKNEIGGMFIAINTCQESNEYKIRYHIDVINNRGNRSNCSRGKVCPIKAPYLYVPPDFVTSNLIVDDCLTVNCILSSRRTITSSLLEKEENSGNLEKLSEDFYTLLTTASMADLNLEVEGQKIAVHSLILSARSPIFSTMMRNDMLESCNRNVIIPGFTFEAVTNMVKYIYSGKLNVKDMSSSLLSEMYAVADKYALLDLKEMCRQYMMSDLKKGSIDDYLLKAIEHNDQGMVEFIGDFLADNLQIIHTLKQKELVKKIPDFLDRMLLAFTRN